EEPLSGVPAGWVSSVHRFNMGSMTRSYLMIRPKSQSPTPLPVVVVLHGRYLTPAGIERLSDMPATTGPAIEVYPAGYGRSWNAGGCCGVAQRAGIDDVAFLDRTVSLVLSSQHDAAANAVYLIGYSNGGRMAYRMACAHPGAWAGVAAVEAVPVDPCDAAVGVPIIVIASSHDPLLTIDTGRPQKVMAGSIEPTVQTTVEDWRHLDGCGPEGAESVVGVATVETWSSCRGAGRVAFALYSGGSHAWPTGVEGRAGTPSAGDLLWGWLHDRSIVTAAA
ncbi:MAG: alpha/beta hydrolase family esterase, partial [Pseudonocardiaceae bacterium]